MKNKIIILLFFISNYCNSQDFGQMYWQMRQRLLDKFIRVGNCHGCSIPGTLVKFKEPNSNGISIDELFFQDESLRHIGWYLGVLATEHRLLTLQNQGSLANEQELYYALETFNRLDLNAEYLRFKGEFNEDGDGINSNPISNLTWDNATKKFGKAVASSLYSPADSSNLNGYLIREDVPPHFEENFWPDENYIIKRGGTGGWIIDNIFVSNKRPSIISQDQFYQMMIGLAFVVRYIPDNTNYNGHFLKKMAKDICERVMSRYNNWYKLIDPLTNSVVVDGEGESIGSSAFYAPMLIVAAQSIINEEEYLGPVQMLDNPYYNPFVTGFLELWDYPSLIPPDALTTYNANSIADVNSIMPLLLISVSDALRFYSINMSPVVLARGAEIGEERNEGYKIYGNIYNLVNEKNDESLGYNKAEMENMLGAMTCEGPHWNMEVQSHFYDIGNFSQSNFESWFTTNVQSVMPTETHIKYTENTETSWNGVLQSSISYSWLKSQNPIWNRDNIFVQQPNNIVYNYERNGHYNGIDYMLMHNIYRLSIAEGKTGFGMSIPQIINDVPQFCGTDCVIEGNLPIIFPQHSAIINEPVNCVYFFRPAEIGTIDNPLIRASLGTMTIGQDLSPLTLPLISNVINPPNQLTCSLTVENKTYIPHAIYYSSEGFDFLDNFDSNDNVYLDMAYLPECAYQYSAKCQKIQQGINCILT